MKSNQKGFSFVEVLIVVVIVGLLGAVGWLVYDHQSNKASQVTNTQESTSQKEQTSDTETVKQFSATGFSLDTSKLPAGWTAERNTPDAVTISSGSCFVEAIKVNDETLSSSRQAEGVQALLTTNDKTNSKGYTVTDKGASTLSIHTSAGVEKVTSNELLWEMPNGGDPFRFSNAYSVQDGYYVSIKRSCSSEADFAKTDAAISAIIFEQ